MVDTDAKEEVEAETSCDKLSAIEPEAVVDKLADTLSAAEAE